MNIVVQKYGGSSVATPEKIKFVAKKISNRVQEGFKVIVIVSAMGKTTDKLIELAKKVSNSPHPRELDMLLTTGEQMSVALLSIALNDLNISSKSLNAFQAGIFTTGDYNNARIQKFKTDKILSLFKIYDVLVITGFQGINEDGDYTTLGRGGSDTSAVAIAAALNINCEIYSDFAGIYTFDPKIYPEAKKLKYITYDEMLEMASLGAKVLHSRAVEVAKKFNVKIYCASTFLNEEGTYVIADNIENPVVTGMSILENQTQVTITNLPLDHEKVYNIFDKIAHKGFNVDMISIININNKLNLSFTIIEEEMEHFDRYLKEALEDVDGSEINYEHGYVKVSVVGIGMKTEKGVASRFFRALRNIPIKMVTTSEIKISCLIEKQYLSEAINSITKEFEL
ncbi:aspartate kinase [Marinitoga sp. 1135]|uniref:Aspartokinase n=1 Tax=Marinitoga piezophila (strain DSM 14283 / JCM 11233 / KA3) TaxID=443254 RepID=H2J5N5_MARPK|nr:MULTISPECIES: aspartate kinase [Marinitoga]AEX85021.1 aspartate kinase [Marinitoga piezophila KA3]APT75534.1 aspartate kinase [Marinitoga sp. 1137]NUU95245.1 aspartate kinase [Marinitoga sp. 1135]NUU97178.1 aspartate kinase [Marinitoga sp. 1138]